MSDSSPPRDRFERKFVKPASGRTLIVGSRVYAGRDDRRELFEDVVGVDMLGGEGVDVVHDLEHSPPKSLGTFRHAECLSVLEHSKRPWMLAANVQKLLEPGGTLYLSAPFIWRYHAFPDDYFRYTAEGIRVLFPLIQWTRLMYCSDGLKDTSYLRAVTVNEHPYMPRCEIVGFGVRV